MQEDNYEIIPSKNEQDGLLAISSATDLMMTSLDKVNSITSDFNDMVHTLANMHVAVEQIEAELEAFKTATGRNSTNSSSRCLFLTNRWIKYPTAST